ncbi:MAG: DUF1858 domain-containing protein [Melioribacter sp.]|nr:DUF1858 domain-containing protein [Melioribacter sp.]
MITKDISIEDLINLIPESVEFLMEKGIRCMQCGEPIWGTLESVAKDKGFSEKEIDNFILELNKMYLLNKKAKIFRE